MKCALQAAKMLKPNGIIILDDSHWPILTETFERLLADDWKATTVGEMHTRHTGEIKYHQTTVFSGGS